MTSTLGRFRAGYAAQRAAEGRALDAEALLRLPYLRSGPVAAQWGVKARSYDAFRQRVLRPLAAGRALRVLDAGAGNGWLSYRIAREGHTAIALDIRDDSVDGLGAAGGYQQRHPGLFTRVAGSFTEIPLADATIDLVLFNASLHYAVELRDTLREAARVLRPGGRMAILDSPFYADERDGEAMVAEKRFAASAQFGERADALMAIPFIEFLTAERLARASAPLGLGWRRHRVLYPLWYELRPWRARLQGRRPPSRFDLWESLPL